MKYQVPNLSSYLQYIKNAYKFVEPNEGFEHKNDDPSNISVRYELKRFSSLMKHKNREWKEGEERLTLFKKTSIQRILSTSCQQQDYEYYQIQQWHFLPGKGIRRVMY